MIELLKQYPKAAKKVREYYLEKFIETLKDPGLDEEFRAHVREQGIDDEKVAKVLQSMPRGIFDMFDQELIYIEIIPKITIGEFDEKLSDNNIMFFAGVNGKAVNVSMNRKDSERKAIEKAFELLEQKLEEKL